MKRIIPLILLVSGLVSAAPTDELAAVRQLAEQGDTNAQFFLGSMYRDGRGVAQNQAEMLRWWRRAAEAGNFDAQNALGTLYSGGFGVDKDLVLSWMWFDILAARATDEFLGEIAHSNRNAVGLFMTQADIEKAQQLSGAWQSTHTP